ncbi:HAMP domain-containing sensor histidine kinase [Gordonia sp. CPCC 205515]|uniref:sensor histidine kinase n=1 Tax=Gordonia sp. CPCC 205515 TaxID=3140791 RepID=UPI003AF4009D
MPSRVKAIYLRIRGWFRPVRTRLTVLATALVTVALAVAAVIMVFALRHVLLRSADAATSARVEQIATTLTHEGERGIDPSLLSTDQNVAVIQIVDASGTLRLTNEKRFDRPMSPPLAPGEQRVIHGAHAQYYSAEEFQTTARGVTTSDGPRTIMVGAAETPINTTVITVAILCCIVFPLIVAGMAVLTHYFVGRTLQPVDDIRRRVDDISGGDLTQRVPVPAGGDEIATLASTMNDMLGRIETARQEQLRFVNDASHELNSPLTTLVGLLDLARVKNHSLDVETIDTVMLPEALRLQNMVADLLLLARADESGVPLRIDDVDLDEIVSAEVTRLEALTGSTIDANIVAVRIRGDAEKLARALRNITDNAVRHTRDSITVSMSVDPAQDTATITVSDNGPGIPDNEKVRVTERFVRLDTARERSQGGSGLGLSIVTEIVRAHHGTVSVTDSPTGGASVGFSLPADS